MSPAGAPPCKAWPSCEDYVTNGKESIWPHICSGIKMASASAQRSRHPPQMAVSSPWRGSNHLRLVLEVGLGAEQGAGWAEAVVGLGKGSWIPTQAHHCFSPLISCNSLFQVLLLHLYSIIFRQNSIVNIIPLASHSDHLTHFLKPLTLLPACSQFQPKLLILAPLVSLLSFLIVFSWQWWPSLLPSPSATQRSPAPSSISALSPWLQLLPRMLVWFYLPLFLQTPPQKPPFPIRPLGHWRTMLLS